MTTIGEKAAHVRRAHHVPGHLCHWPGCQVEVPPARWGCLPHWRMLPRDLQRRIWATYRIGQEDDKRPSAAYLAVAREVQDWIAKQEGRMG